MELFDVDVCFKERVRFGHFQMTLYCATMSCDAVVGLAQRNFNYVINGTKERGCLTLPFKQSSVTTERIVFPDQCSNVCVYF